MDSFERYKQQLEEQRLVEEKRRAEVKKLKKEMEYKAKMESTKFGCGVVILVLIIISLAFSFYTVPAGNVGIVTRFGAVMYTANPGLGMRLPFIDGVIWMDTRTQKEEVKASAASSDLQDVDATIATNYRLDPAYALWVYQNIGADYEDKVVSPAIQNTFKAVTAQFVAGGLIQQREVVTSKAKELLSVELAKYHLLDVNFNVINFDFSAEYNKAIEEKQVAQQEVQTSEQRLAKAKIEAQQKVVEAQAQADSQKALKDTGALSPEYLQFLAIQKWDGKLPQVTGGGATPLLDLNKLTPTVIK